MIKISEEDKKELENRINNLAKILESDNPNDLLYPLGDLVDAELLRENDYYPTPLGNKLQCIYDRVYYDNCVEEK